MVAAISSFYIYLLASFSVGVLSLCYYPNGSVAPQDTPCLDSTTHSACCGPGYACLSNSICMATGKEQGKAGATELVRGSCTDKSWRSGSCPNFCADPTKDNVGGGMGVGLCRSTQNVFYCINGDKADCDKMQNVLIFETAPSIITTIGVAAKTTSTVSSTAPTSSVSSTRMPLSNESIKPSSISSAITTTPTSSTDSTESTSQSQSTVIGIAVGSTLGGILVIGIIVGFFFWKRKKKAKGDATVNTLPPNATSEFYRQPALAPVSETQYKQEETWRLYQQQQNQQHYEIQEAPAHVPQGLYEMEGSRN